jgi:formylmethanofuran dehydrogenase subunit E
MTRGNTNELVTSFEDDLAAAAAYHGHLCAGQFAGVRMARFGCALLGIAEPRRFRDLFVFVETDRCLADAVSSVTGCKPGKRRLKLIDYGKSAAVFLNAAAGEAVRVASKGWVVAPQDADLRAFFAALSDGELFSAEAVSIQLAPADMPGPPCERVLCESCGEFVTDSRQVERGGRTLCRACAAEPYYQKAVLLEGA